MAELHEKHHAEVNAALTSTIEIPCFIRPWHYMDIVC